MSQSNTVLQGIVLSEKAAFLGGNRVYSFYVADDANKMSISDAIKKQYNVVPTKINVVRIATRSVVKKNKKQLQRGYKKAMITLKEGDVIEFT